MRTVSLVEKYINVGRVRFYVSCNPPRIDQVEILLKYVLALILHPLSHMYPTTAIRYHDRPHFLFIYITTPRIQTIGSNIPKRNI